MQFRFEGIIDATVKALDQRRLTMFVDEEVNLLKNKDSRFLKEVAQFLRHQTSRRHGYSSILKWIYDSETGAVESSAGTSAGNIDRYIGSMHLGERSHPSTSLGSSNYYPSTGPGSSNYRPSTGPGSSNYRPSTSNYHSSSTGPGSSNYYPSTGPGSSNDFLSGESRQNNNLTTSIAMAVGVGVVGLGMLVKGLLSWADEPDKGGRPPRGGNNGSNS